MIDITRIKQQIERTKAMMVDESINRLSIGMMTRVLITYTDFVQAFSESTKHYCLGSEIRIDVDGITYCAEMEAGTAREGKDDGLTIGEG